MSRFSTGICRKMSFPNGIGAGDLRSQIPLRSAAPIGGPTSYANSGMPGRITLSSTFSVTGSVRSMFIIDRWIDLLVKRCALAQLTETVVKVDRK
jgi:hypothetical protein